MCTIVNISLPQQMAAAVEAEMKKENFSTKSELFRALLRLWMQGKLVVELEESRKEFRQGKGKLLRSLKDLR